MQISLVRNKKKTRKIGTNLGEGTLERMLFLSFLSNWQVS